MNRDWANLVLRAGLAFAFLYPPLNAISNPESWIGYFPVFVREATLAAGISDLVLLHAFGVAEVIIAVWILSGWRIFLPSAAATVILLSIVAFDHANFEVLFRDVSIAAIAIVLAIQSGREFSKKPLTLEHGM
ncbi:MAG TPA: hypothetical protein VI483_03615 [Candidatus Paceibacterota bacterium]